MERQNLRQVLGRMRGQGPGMARRGWLAVLGVALVLALGLGLVATTARQSAVPLAALRDAAPGLQVQAATANRAVASADTSAPAAAALQDAAAGAAAAPNWDRMIIRTATLQLTVKDVAASLDEVRALAGAHGGYITTSDSHQEGNYTVASLTLQVPVQEFDTVIPLLRRMSVKPVHETIGSSDVTEEYTDLQSQLRNLQATEAHMLALQQKAAQLSDVLALDRELRQVQGDIERTQGRINYLSKRSQMSTITVGFYPEAVAPDTQATWDPGAIVTRAWNASLDLLAGAAGTVLTVVVFLWWVVPVLALGLWLVRRPRRRPAATPAP